MLPPEDGVEAAGVEGVEDDDDDSLEDDDAAEESDVLLDASPAGLLASPAFAVSFAAGALA